MSLGWRAGVVAAAVGAGWAVSPLGTAELMTLWAIGVAMTADLHAVERRRVRLIVAAAVALRLALLAGVFVTTPPGQQSHTIFPDSLFLIDRSIWLRNLWMNVPLGPHQYLAVFDPYGASSFATFLAVLQVGFGPAPFGLSVLSAALYVCGSLAVFRVVHRGYGAAPARVGLVALLFWPSLVAWSISVLKEPAQLFLASIVCAGAVSIAWSRPAARAIWLVASAGALALLATLRAGGIELAGVGLALAVVLRLMAWRRWVVAVLVAFAIAGAWATRERIGHQVQLAASRHIGHVKSAGVSYRLLDERYYSDNGESVDSMSFTEGGRFLTAAAIAFVVVPLPWQAGSRGTLALLPEQLAWCLMCASAIAGCVVGMRRAPWLTCVLAGSALAGLLIIAPNSGNVGTLMRHRDLIVPFVLWLGCLGVVGVAQTASAAGAPVQELSHP